MDDINRDEEFLQSRRSLLLKHAEPILFGASNDRPKKGQTN